MFFGLFCKTQKKFRFVLVFWTSIEQPKQTDFFRNTPKKSPKNAPYKGFLKTINFWGVPTETNQNSIFFGYFCYLCGTNKNFLQFVWFISVCRTGIETTETSRTYGMGN
jgi:hypothetical protein